MTRYLQSAGGFVAAAALVWVIAGERGLTQGRAAGAQTPVDVQSLGPQVGAPVPDFTLRDQHGQPRTLASLRGPKGTLLVFFRSADW